MGIYSVLQDNGKTLNSSMADLYYKTEKDDSIVSCYLAVFVFPSVEGDIDINRFNICGYLFCLALV